MRALLLLVLLASAALAAPVPPVAPRKAASVRPDGPVTADDLRAVRWLLWSEQRWPILLETATGEGYTCRHHDPMNRTVWQGACWLVDGEVVLEESSYTLHPDAPPEHVGGPNEQRLKVAWKGGKLVGTGWGAPIELRTTPPPEEKAP